MDVRYSIDVIFMIDFFIHLTVFMTQSESRHSQMSGLVADSHHTSWKTSINKSTVV